MDGNPCISTSSTFINPEEHEADFLTVKTEDVDEDSLFFQTKSAEMQPEEMEIVTVKSEEIFPCSICPETFNSLNEFQKHFTIHSGESNLLDESFNEIHSQRRHIITLRSGTSSDRQNQNKVCGIKINESLSPEELILPQTSKQTHTCLNCSMIFKTKLKLKKHSVQHHGGKSSYCSICSLPFSCDFDLNRHIEIEHMTSSQHSKQLDNVLVNDTAGASGVVNWDAYTCDLCGRRFKSTSAKCQHRETHLPRSKCSCGGSFANKGSLRKHRKRYNHYDPAEKIDSDRPC